MTAEYALRAIVLLARTPAQARSADEIAEATRVPRRYVNKVLQALVRARLIGSRSGPGGGYALVHAPERVSILDVVAAVEPIARIVECPLGIEGHIDLCRLHRQLNDASAYVERTFAGVSIADLLGEADGPPPLCEPK